MKTRVSLKYFVRYCSLSGNMLTGKGILRAGYGNKEGKRVLRAGYGNKEERGVLRNVLLGIKT